MGSIIDDDSGIVDAAELKIEEVSVDTDDHTKQVSVLSEKEIDTDALPADLAAGSKPGKPEVKWVSLTEFFTPEQIREHLSSLRQWAGQHKAKAEKERAMENSVNESCGLCSLGKLTFELPIYCSACGDHIKPNARYYITKTAETPQYFCRLCVSRSFGRIISADGSSCRKAELECKRNDQGTEEWWVQCDECGSWQHQICALFKVQRNGEQGEYTCPICYLKKIETGECKPAPQSAVLGAKDLPRTKLSDHIEQRLSKRLKQERDQRARHMGKSFDEVPGVEELSVRVVSSIDRKLGVKQQFLEIFHGENYPTEFPYKSKAILLFQKIEGVEVCLLGMYVHEFGSECSLPNQRCVYVSYLDSLKYFRPEIKAATGEALRTFVYHDILIGYLDYCKKRGFTSCYIWACPPRKRQDYIFYCHPDFQKTLSQDKLRKWYLSMLRKGSDEDIVVDITNLYDLFFVTTGECKAKVTAARLPYFDGDYWVEQIEDVINQLPQEDGREEKKARRNNRSITKRTLKDADQAELASNASKDVLLMQKLSEIIGSEKENFIMVHLQHACSRCCLLMVSGKRWVCPQCKSFEYCEKCYDVEQRIQGHSIHCEEKHKLYPVEVTGVPLDTKDKDDILESEFFGTKQAFLSFCQVNKYQYDTLRRAKHSSMMVLHHLHNPTAPALAFATMCRFCHHDIENGQGWYCEICSDFHVCNGCYLEDVGLNHPHKLTNPPSMAEAQSITLSGNDLVLMLNVLVHASRCNNGECQDPKCHQMKLFFRHGKECEIRYKGGCQKCKKMWYLLKCHARHCKESECQVPRCRDLKEHFARSQQSDSG